ncbi:MAG: hypothetical protein E7647_05490 [Ruminococcaceae bacterium]|nr:hypothetical protein [Oscillospiraceae bacterium]
MKKIDTTVKKESLYILIWTVILSLLMQSVILILNRWDPSILWGNLLGGGAAVCNFFVMGLFVQSALGKEEKDAKNIIRLSQSLRFLMLVAVGAVGYLVPIFNVVTTVLPFLFPRIAIAFRPLFEKRKEGE